MAPHAPLVCFGHRDLVQRMVVLVEQGQGRTQCQLAVPAGSHGAALPWHWAWLPAGCWVPRGTQAHTRSAGHSSPLLQRPALPSGLGRRQLPGLASATTALPLGCAPGEEEETHKNVSDSLEPDLGPRFHCGCPFTDVQFALPSPRLGWETTWISLMWFYPVSNEVKKSRGKASLLLAS